MQGLLGDSGVSTFLLSAGCCCLSWRAPGHAFGCMVHNIRHIPDGLTLSILLSLLGDSGVTGSSLLRSAAVGVVGVLAGMLFDLRCRDSRCVGLSALLRGIVGVTRSSCTRIQISQDCGTRVCRQASSLICGAGDRPWTACNCSFV